ncbi:MAG: hypothetical protein NWQ88_01945, partial [Aquiluna sp.]|nr:hypothetical protein [Aquiluna sp.]
MAKRGDVSRLRGVLRLGSLVFGLSAIALLFAPRLFLDLLGIAGSPDLDWSMQMIGITLVALSGNMFVVSFHA